MTELRALIHSNAPFIDGGYGIQAGQLARKLQKEGYEVAISAFYGLQGKRLVIDGIPVFPGETYSDDSLVGHYKYFGANVLITLMDVWTMNPAMLEGMNVYAWTPIDTDDHLSIKDTIFFQSAKNVVPIAMSRHGRKLLARAGFDALYVPHSVDTDVFKPLSDEERAEVRRLGGLDDDTFVIGICAANKSKTRKGWYEQFQAFKLFHDKHPNSLLYVHSLNNDQFLHDGVDLRVMCHRYGINKWVRFSDQYALRAGMVTPEMMRRWFGHIDVLSAASQGEGFGLPALEAQACGTPVVVTKASAMKEIGKIGWQVSGHYIWNDEHQANWVSPSIEGLADAYAAAYMHAGDERLKGDQGLHSRAVHFAQQYSIENVWNKYWKPALASIEAKI